jgi:HK97 family phage portal protein
MGLFSGLNKKAESVKNVIVDNAVFEALLGWLSPGTQLQRNSSLYSYLDYGYGKNADVFSITQKIITLFAQVPIKITKGETEVQNPVTLNNKSFYEFRQIWEMFAILSGESIHYTPKPIAGNNQGVPVYIEPMPSQHVEIISGGWTAPVRGYRFDLNSLEKEIPPEDVWHARIFPNWDYTNGANFRGMSPIKAAVNIINAQNNGYNVLSKSFERGMPPGILTRKDLNDVKMIREHEDTLTRAWLKNHGKSDKAGLPVFSIGDYNWIQLGFSTLRDMDIINSTTHGLRVLCNLWGIPATLLNDMSSSTYNNLRTATRSIYTNRIIPDLTLFCDGLSKLYEPLGIKFTPDLSAIPELQDDKMEQAKVYEIGVRNKAISRNEFRQALGFEPIDAYGMELEDLLSEENQPISPEDALRQLQERNGGNDYERKPTD